jgi:2-dehydro-3-deoxyphosphogalactonate aldolase
MSRRQPIGRAVREVLPVDVRVWAAGGTAAEDLREWLAAGAEGVGVGGALCRPGDSAAIVSEKARTLMEAWAAR